MLKKSLDLPHAPKAGHFDCSRLDTGSEALPNDRSYTRHLFGKASRNVAIGTGEQSEL
jgi:hypothetical protein